MKKMIGLVGLFFLLLAINGYAPNTTFTCLDGNISRESVFLLIDVGGNSTNITLTEDQNCNNGCNNLTGECNISSFDTSYLIIFLMFPIISFVLLYFVSILKSEDWAIHLLLIIAAIMFLVAPLGILQGMQEQASNIFLGMPIGGLYQLLLVIMIFVIFYYLLKLIVNAVKLMKARRGEPTG